MQTSPSERATLPADTADASITPGSADFSLTSPHHPPTMHVIRRDGSREAVDVNKIVRAVKRCAGGLSAIDPMRVALKTIGGLYDGASTRELDELSIRTAAALTAEEPEYSTLAARLLAGCIAEEVSAQDIHSFSQAVACGFRHGIHNERLRDFVAEHARELDAVVTSMPHPEFDYFGLRTVYDRYLLRHPSERTVIETAPYFFMRVACALGGGDMEETLALFERLSALDYLPSSPTLFNAGTAHEQLSSCYLLDSPTDSLEGIYGKYTDIARLSKFAGGIGVAFSRVRSRGSLIRGTNGLSNGLVPWLKTLDASVAAVNQGGRRKGAACVYLEPWHADVMDFLELRDNTGDEARRTHNLNIANWVPDLFMRRVEADAEWSLFDPKTVPALVDTWGEDFEHLYEKAERDGLAVRTVKARDVYTRMLRTLAQTGNGWMTFKDRSNATCNQTAKPDNVVHLSNLCTEILEVSSASETAVCNLASINLAHHVTRDDGGRPAFDFDKLADTVRLAIRQLDRVIDINFYPIDAAHHANARWRPVGLGVMGLQDVFFRLHIAFDSDEAVRLSARIAEEIYFHALSQSSELAATHGAHPGFADTRAARGELQFDYWPDAQPGDCARWDVLRDTIKQQGLRNSLMIAIAPTATIASIAGCESCIEPIVSNLYKRETLSGDFLVINRHLVEELKSLGLWTADIRDAIKRSDGSIQSIDAIPTELRGIYRTAWELPQKALIDHAAARGAYIDQSQSLNLFMQSPNIGRMSSMYMYAWKTGIKTTYYLRSRPATGIAKTTVGAGAAVACSLENPESCEACQ